VAKVVTDRLAVLEALVAVAVLATTQAVLVHQDRATLAVLETAISTLRVAVEVQVPLVAHQQAIQVEVAVRVLHHHFLALALPMLVEVEVVVEH
jgi:hypothetical protein